MLSFFNLDPDAITYHKFLTEVDKGDKVGGGGPGWGGVTAERQSVKWKERVGVGCGGPGVSQASSR